MGVEMNDDVEYVENFIAESLLLLLFFIGLSILNPTIIQVFFWIYVVYLIYILCINKLPFNYLVCDLWK